MKKNIIFSLLIIYFIISILMTIRMFTYNRTISVKDITKYTSTINENMNLIDKISDINCKKSFNNMVDRINSTHFNENVGIKTYYDAYFKNNKTFLDFYNDVVTNCEIKYNENTYSNAIASMNYPYQVRKEYLLRYEYSFRDLINQKNINKTNDELGTFSNKHLEVLVLSDLLKEVNV